MTLFAPARIGLVTKVLVTVGSVSAVTVSTVATEFGSGALSNVDVNTGLVLLPALVGVTNVVTVQLPRGANVILDRPILLLADVPVPAVTAAVDPPVQLIVTKGGFVLTKLPGYGSRNTAPIRLTVVVVFGLVMVIDSVVLSPTFTGLGENDLTTVGAATTV